MNEPKTQAGRNLVDDWYNIDLEFVPRPRAAMVQDVLAVEAEAADECWDIVQEQAAIMVREKSHDWLGVLIADPQTRDYIRDAALTLRDWMVEPDEDDEL